MELQINNGNLVVTLHDGDVIGDKLYRGATRRISKGLAPHEYAHIEQSMVDKPKRKAPAKKATAKKTPAKKTATAK